jgi:hypothetical protein
LILFFQFVDVNHDWRHYFGELWIVGQKSLILISELDNSDFFQHDVNDLSIELNVSKVKVEKVVMSFLPTLYNETPEIRSKVTILFTREVEALFFPE